MLVGLLTFGWQQWCFYRIHSLKIESNTLSKTNLPVEPNNPNWLKTNKQKTMKPNWRKWPTPALLTYYQNEHTFLKQIPQFNNSIEPRWKKKKGLCDSTTGLKQAKSELHMKREHKNFFQKQTDQFYFSNLTPQPHQTQMEEEEGPRDSTRRFKIGYKCTWNVKTKPLFRNQEDTVANKKAEEMLPTSMKHVSNTLSVVFFYSEMGFL